MEPTIRIQAGAGKSHENFARNWKPQVLKRAEQVQTETRTQKEESGLELGTLPKVQPETRELEASGASPSWNLNAKTGIWAGARQSHESSAQKPETVD